MKSRKISQFRKLSIYGFQVTENSHNLYALLEFDISSLRKVLRDKRSEGNGGSLFAFFLKAIAECLRLYPEFNSMINLKKVTTFEDVDISVPIEIMGEEEIYNKQLVIRNVEKKTIKEIDDEINESKHEIGKGVTYMDSPFLRSLITSLPKYIVKMIFALLIRNHKKVKEYSGTTFVTSVSMFSKIPGYIIPYIGKPKSCAFSIGSVYKKPVVIADRVEIREVVNITAIFNHDMIDGAPAARLINTLRRFIENDYMVLIG